MNLAFDRTLIENYHSSRQIARVLTEDWVNQNMYCPRCGHAHIQHFENNSPVADFYCPSCSNQFELKSTSASLTHKVPDGAYSTMIKRITSNHNPDFFFMNYSKRDLKVTDIVLVPKHFFLPEIIEKRKPLAATARRAGWIGCNILLDKIPEQGRIDIISHGEVINRNNVIGKIKKSFQLEIKDLNRRGWLMDTLNCMNTIPDQTFTLNDMYTFEEVLHLKHPQNHNIRPKIRQQLQLLRDKGFVEFLGNGTYRKII